MSLNLFLNVVTFRLSIFNDSGFENFSILDFIALF